MMKVQPIYNQHPGKFYRKIEAIKVRYLRRWYRLDAINGTDLYSYIHVIKHLSLMLPTCSKTHTNGNYLLLLDINKANKLVGFS